MSEINYTGNIPSLPSSFCEACAEKDKQITGLKSALAKAHLAHAETVNDLETERDEFAAKHEQDKLINQDLANEIDELKKQLAKEKDHVET